MNKVTKKNHRLGSLFLEEIKFDHVFKRKVMRSGNVGKIYLPKEMIGKNIYVVVQMDANKN